MFAVDKQHKISHSAITIRDENILGGEDGGQLESERVAGRVIDVLDHINAGINDRFFGPFQLPQRLSRNIRLSINAFYEFGAVEWFTL